MHLVVIGGSDGGMSAVIQARELRSNVHATALFNGLSVDAINDLNPNYPPPCGTPWDAVQRGTLERERSARLTSAA